MNVVASTDLIISMWVGRRWRTAGDRLRYIVWVDAGRGHGERAPRTALHLVVCNGGGP